jgi:RNA recognition motif-containing protein
MSNRRTLYVSSLNQQVNEAILYQTFLPFGEIRNVKLPREDNVRSREISAPIMQQQRHKGYALVEFEESEDSKQALDNLHLSELCGDIISVQYLNPKAGKKESQLFDLSRSVWNQPQPEYMSLEDIEQETTNVEQLQENATKQDSSE